MAGPVTLLRRLTAIALGLVATSVPMSANAQSVIAGTFYRCPSSDERSSVEAWVGRVERWADHGVQGVSADTILVHLQLRIDGGGLLDQAAHAPFEASALQSCTMLPAGSMTPDSRAFEEGYDVWLKAVLDQGAGAFTMPPADAFWAVIGIRDDGAGL